MQIGEREKRRLSNARKTIFELTWIGTDDRLKLEPSILLEGLGKITIKVITITATKR